jgi:hypothetical protein
MLLDTDNGDSKPKYFHAYRNTHVFPTALVFSNQRDLITLRERLDRMDVFEQMSLEREDTKWFLSHVTNVTFDVTVMKPDQPLVSLE